MNAVASYKGVMPAQAGIHLVARKWIPAFAGMTQGE
jgi:hypothetical protein